MDHGDEKRQGNREKKNKKATEKSKRRRSPLSLRASRERRQRKTIIRASHDGSFGFLRPRDDNGGESKAKPQSDLSDSETKDEARPIGLVRRTPLSSRLSLRARSRRSWEGGRQKPARSAAFSEVQLARRAAILTERQMRAASSSSSAQRTQHRSRLERSASGWLAEAKSVRQAPAVKKTAARRSVVSGVSARYRLAPGALRVCDVQGISR